MTKFHRVAFMPESFKQSFIVAAQSVLAFDASTRVRCLACKGEGVASSWGSCGWAHEWGCPCEDGKLETTVVCDRCGGIGNGDILLRPSDDHLMVCWVIVQCGRAHDFVDGETVQALCDAMARLHGTSRMVGDPIVVRHP